jgi:signal transduction histidine kinase
MPGVHVRAGAASHNDAATALAVDRERIAGELCDHVIPRLFGVGLGLSALAGALEDTRQVDALLGYIGEIEGAIGQVRSIIFDRSAMAGTEPGPDEPA